MPLIKPKKRARSTIAHLWYAVPSGGENLIAHHQFMRESCLLSLLLVYTRWFPIDYDDRPRPGVYQSRTSVCWCSSFSHLKFLSFCFVLFFLRQISPVSRRSRLMMTWLIDEWFVSERRLTSQDGHDANSSTSIRTAFRLAATLVVGDAFVDRSFVGRRRATVRAACLVRAPAHPGIGDGREFCAGKNFQINPMLKYLNWNHFFFFKLYRKEISNDDNGSSRLVHDTVGLTVFQVTDEQVWVTCVCMCVCVSTGETTTTSRRARSLNLIFVTY